MRLPPPSALVALVALGVLAAPPLASAGGSEVRVPPPPPKPPTIPTPTPVLPVTPPPAPVVAVRTLRWIELLPPSTGPVVPAPVVPAPVVLAAPAFNWVRLDAWLRGAERSGRAPRIEIVFPDPPKPVTPKPSPRKPGSAPPRPSPPKPLPVVRQVRPAAWAAFLRELHGRYTGRIDPDASGPAARLPRVGHWYVGHLEHTRPLEPGEPLRSTLVPTIAPRPVDVLAAGPIVTPTDHADVRAKELRVTFSPNGDGIADAVDLVVAGPPGRAVQATAWWPWRLTRNTVWTSRPVVLDPRGTARVRWDGLTPGSKPLGDGAYNVGVCLLEAERPAPPAPAAGRPPCAPQVVRAHRRNLAAGILSAGSFLPGEAVPLTIGSDHGAVTVGVLPDDGPDTGPGAGLQTIEPGVPVSYRLPTDLTPGTHRLAVTDAVGARRLLPLVIRDATFAVEAPPPGTALVVEPYLTWRAYNGWDEDRSGRADTWYANFNGRGWVSLVGPYEDIATRGSAGAEYDYRYARNFMTWFRSTPGRRAQFITDVELAAMDPGVLARYRLVLVPGHVEYYPQRSYELLRDYRDIGGRLAFLSANSFFQTVEIQPELNRVQAGVRALRTSEQSDFGLVGIGFAACCRAPEAWPAYTVHPGVNERLPWLLDGTGLTDGTSFGRFDGEADGASPTLSPPGLVLVASGPVGDRLVSMSYLETASGGEVFSTGNIGFLDLLTEPEPGQDPAVVLRILDNAWSHMLR